MGTDVVQVETEGAIATLRLHRPDARNSFDVATLIQMRAAVQRLVDEPAVRAVVLTGTGRFFCTGADIGEMVARRDDAPRLFDDLTLHYHALLQTMARSDTAFVSAVNGVAAGGGVGLALGADLVVMAEEARLVLAYGNLGVSPDGGVTGHLTRLAGPLRARAAILLDEGIDAPTALEWGLANRVVATDGILDAAGEMAARAAARSRHTIRETKRLVALASHAAMDETLEAEREAIIRGARGADLQEGIDAFREKRPPRFAD